MRLPYPHPQGYSTDLQNIIQPAYLTFATMTEDQLLTSCLRKIEAKTGWGPVEGWTNHDFTELSARIADTTSVHLSATTLKRVWGRVAYASKPSVTTLDALARYAGQENWRAFRQTVAVPENTLEAVTASQPRPKRLAKNPARLYLYYLLPLAALAVVISLLSSESTPAPAAAPTAPVLNPADYAFSFRPVASGVPNSVVFNYDASAAPYDSIYLQQNWDRRRRERIPRSGKVHTSIYYLPGFFNAKLVVGDQVVQTRDLYLRSEGWVTAIDADPVPVYLPPTTTIQDGRIAITEDHLKTLGIPLQPEPPTSVITHVGALDGLFSDNFTFRTRLRHDYATGASVCQRARVLLLLKNSAIIIPLSRPGCVADLYLLAGGQEFRGRDFDLSAFGVVGDNWLELEFVGKDDLLTFSVNGRKVFTVESEQIPKEFVGIRYEFSGLGSVDELYFGNDAGTVWAENFSD
ncbi:MAG: hypothetical protein AAGA62_00705 [Bacteroidota bacterium]